MKIVQSNDTYKIYGDDLRTYDLLPAQTYVIRYGQFTGFYIQKHLDFEINEDKIYGVHLEKINKVLRSYNNFERSLGIILSGKKGMGKSLFAKLLAKSVIEKNIPVIIVDEYVPGIASFIESIDQEVLILFDEFDKTFGENYNKENPSSPQTEMLSLFDGVASGKKIFVITCNNVNNLNEFLINRPGRFHYHLRFEYPSREELTEYLRDKLKEEYYDEIEKVLNFNHRVKLNYDCLRSIAFELNNGEKFEDAIMDLNIVNTETPKYSIDLVFEDGMKLECSSQHLDLFNERDEYTRLYDRKGSSIGEVYFNTKKCLFD